MSRRAIHGATGRPSGSFGIEPAAATAGRKRLHHNRGHQYAVGQELIEIAAEAVFILSTYPSTVPRPPTG
jgi:hypothetical protein